LLASVCANRALRALCARDTELSDKLL